MVDRYGQEGRSERDPAAHPSVQVRLLQARVTHERERRAPKISMLLSPSTLETPIGIVATFG